MPDFIEGLTDIQENCAAVFAVVEGPEDCVLCGGTAGWWSGLCGIQTGVGESSLWPCDQGQFGRG